MASQASASSRRALGTVVQRQASVSSRRALGTAAQPVSIDWSRPQWTAGPEVTARTNKLRSWVAMSEATYEKYQAPPAPLNFAAAKSAVRDKGLVDMLESFYKSSMPPAETHVMPEEEIVRAEQTIEYLIELDSLNKELLPVLEAEIVFQKENRTTVETTLFDLKVKHPLFHEQIEDEFERREWFKGTEYER